jgi:methyl-accepting chemotaxis protein
MKSNLRNSQTSSARAANGKPKTARANQSDESSIVQTLSQVQAVVEFDPTGTIQTVNDNFLRTVGYTLEEIQGRHHSMFVDEATRQTPEYRDFWVRLGRGEFQSGEFKRIGKGGNEIWIQGSYMPIPDSTGRIYKVIKFCVDVTGLVKARFDAARISSMVEQAPINVMFADREFKIRYVNLASVKTLKEIEHLLPIKADQILGQSIDIFHKRPEHQRHIVGDPKNLPHHAQIQVGPETLDLLVSSIFDHNKNYLGAMVTWEVITKRLLLEQEIKENKEKAAKLGSILEAVANSARALATSSEELTAVSSEMKSNSEETSTQANVVSAAAEQVSKNVQTVATGVEEMGASIREIAGNATQAAKVAEQAVKTAENTNATIAKLGESSNEIGKVIKVITSIAEQTNLLALNATIEAARAGEAGKGFAVVANEVKELAKETAKATEEIGQKIEAIQGDTKGAVAAIGQIGQVINQINDISNTIATAVEEQTATTNEIARNVAEAAKGSSEIAQNITSVARAAESTTQGANNTQQAASELSRMADELQQLVANSQNSGAADSGPTRPGRDGAAGWQGTAGRSPAGLSA